jgi:hypothetical protein
MRIDSFVLELEHQTTFRYYYDTTDFDSTRINLSVKDKPLTEVLSLAFANTDIYYTMDANNHVFFSKGKSTCNRIACWFAGRESLLRATYKKGRRRVLRMIKINLHKNLRSKINYMK